ncbi:MAG: hypothetical protein CMI00_06885 [Oceanospirillaceae bacterium]|nr:hypothetical protein [Oceanospirillaceae bacterium]|tara:strand:+ start:1065 stop:1637 length:573 start_codon:yes stop_codon:yes gene_type:complete
MQQEMPKQERRRYFRLDDEVILDFEPISQTEAQEWKSRHCNQRNELADLNRDIATLLHQIQTQNPTVARLLNLFNSKVNMLSTGKEIDFSQTEVRTRVNLSACGMSFQTSEHLETGENLRLQMQLQPSNVPVTLLGTIVGIETTDDPAAPHLIRVDFEGLREAEQEILIHHLFQLQTQNLRSFPKALNDE